MSNMEKNFNKICSSYGSIYFCTHNFDSRGVHVGLILNVMGFNRDCVDSAARELFDMLKRISIIDNLNFLDLPKDLDAISESRGNSPQPKSRDPCDNSILYSRLDSSHECEDTSDMESHIINMSNDIVINVSCVPLVKQVSEVVVCITNCRLQCTEPLSRAVVAAVGAQHRKDCDSYLRDKGALKPCQVMHADAGHLFVTVRKIINVVEPKAEDPATQHCMLEDLYFNCLQYANNEIKAESISFPFFSNELNKIPSPVIAHVICKALVKFVEQFTDSERTNLRLHRVNIACAHKKTALIQKKVFDIVRPRLKHLKPNEAETLKNSTTTLSRSFCFASNEVTSQSLKSLNDEFWWKKRVTTNLTQLQLEISMDSGFECELFKLEVFEPVVLRRSMEELSDPQKVHHLLNHLLHGDEQMFKNFCQALSLSGQQCVVSRYLSNEPSISRGRSKIQRSVTDSNIREDLKLLQRWKSDNLRRYQNELIEKIICDLGLMSHLKSLAVFTDHQMAQLEAERSEMSRNRLVLGWLERGSEATYRKFCTALTSNNQEHLVINYLLECSILL